MHKHLKYLLLIVCLFTSICEAKPSLIGPQDVVLKTEEMMKAHASHKELTPSLTQRILNNYIEHLDPLKTYFIESDLQEWIHPSEEFLQETLHHYQNHRFSAFEEIHHSFTGAIERRRLLEKQIDDQSLPSNVQAKEFKEMPWAKSEEELLNRLKRIRALQLETTAKFNEEMQTKSLQRIQKRQLKIEENLLVKEPKEREQLILSNILKAMASALDAHTVYFTPGEATQFMINVQQRLCGIGAQLRDDINGLTIIKIIEGGPAAVGKQLKIKDRIVAVNGEPIVGLDISDAVDLIRGETNSPVILTVIRETPLPDHSLKQEKLDLTVLRGEVVIKEARFKSTYEPYGEGVIGYLKLHSFYQDPDNSSASDLEEEIEKLKKNHSPLGLVLDLRYNSGGLLSQAVAVTGLFITKGVVVSIKDENGKIQHLRALGGTTAWDGPLIVLVNRMSASASEIVAQTLQDYGRALIVGDDHTFGKGSYQTFTLNTTNPEQVNPQGEYKVTRGCYYTVSGDTPQLKGVIPHVEVPGPLSESEIGERFAKYPLTNDSIKPNFNDDLSDVPFLQRDRIRKLYKFNLQEKQEIYAPYLEILKAHSKQRLDKNANHQNLLKEVKKKEGKEKETLENFGHNDLQLEEAYAIMKDLLLMMKEKGVL